MASSSSRSRRDAIVVENLFPALQERLGPEATVALLALFEASKRQWSADVIEHSSLRFGRRLTEEAAQTRVEFSHGLNGFRSELKQEMNELRSEFKQEMNELRVELKQEMSELRLELKGDMAGLETRVERALLHQTRWIFGMWVGQLAATAAMMGAMFRIFAQ
jgi:hypothetical protein